MTTYLSPSRLPLHCFFVFHVFILSFIISVLIFSSGLGEELLFNLLDLKAWVIYLQFYLCGRYGWNHLFIYPYSTVNIVLYILDVLLNACNLMIISLCYNFFHTDVVSLYMPINDSIFILFLLILILLPKFCLISALWHILFLNIYLKN